MGFILQLSILSLNALVVCGVPQWLVTPGVSPLLSRKARRVDCDDWCANPDVKGSYLCCEDITQAPPISRVDCKNWCANPDTKGTYLCCEDITQAPPIHYCQGDDFHCPNGVGGVRCIYKSWVCDGVNDCGDNTDEQNCPATTTTATTTTTTVAPCPVRSFQCQNGDCLNKVFVCDGVNDCRDNTDERNCTVTTTTTTTTTTTIPPCSMHSFQCQNGACLNKLFVCNGIDDCGDNTDEQNCTAPTCPGGEFHCSRGDCIPDSLVCDTFNHCGDNTDEQNCTAPLLCTEDLRPDSDCHLAPQTIELECNNDEECTDRESPNHRCCPDACLGKTCRRGYYSGALE